MSDPARKERIEAALAAHYDIPERDGIVATLEAADAIEPRPVYLTAEEREQLARGIRGQLPTNPAARVSGRRKLLQAAQERGEKP